MTRSDPAFEDFKRRAAAVDIKAVADGLGVKLRKVGAAEFAGPCPAGCSSDDGFAINTKKRVFQCRKAGVGGDVISMVQHVSGIGFIDACAMILNEDPPGRGDDAAPARDPDAAEAIARERREERRFEEELRAIQEASELEDTIEKAALLFAAGRTITGTYAADYLENRGLRLSPDKTRDLRFIPKLPYWGFSKPGKDVPLELLGHYHCMVAAVRDVEGRVIGAHRTYLDPKEPIKLRPPGDRGRNAAKKMVGAPGGGLIRLGAIGTVLAVGEGIETTASWYELGLGPDEVTIAAAGSLGNLCGGSTGSRDHPVLRDFHGKPVKISNGEPDMAKPGFVVPAGVTMVILIGDGDSEKFATRMRLQTGALRLRNLGIEAYVSMAADGLDFSDMLRRRADSARDAGDAEGIAA